MLQISRASLQLKHLQLCQARRARRARRAALTWIWSIWLESREIVVKHKSAVIIGVDLQTCTEMRMCKEGFPGVMRTSGWTSGWSAAAPGCTASSHLAAGSPVPGTERVAGLIPGYLLLRRPFYLASPGSLHSVGRHQDPRVPQRVVTQVLVFCIKASSFTKLHVLISTASASTCFTSASGSHRTRVKLELSLLKPSFLPFFHHRSTLAVIRSLVTDRNSPVLLKTPLLGTLGTVRPIYLTGIVWRLLLHETAKECLINRVNSAELPIPDQ